MVETVADMRVVTRRARGEGAAIGLVPTMGCLHAGHLALVGAARRECDLVVVSVYVNPSQFGPGEDYERYPRDLKSDAAKLLEAGIDVVFAPGDGVMYPPGFQTWVDVSRLGQVMCGESRPGHFRGVATVVAKLLNIVQPSRAYFGEKDAQQLRVIRRLVADLEFPVEVVAVPTVRDDSGLALSSRNDYLSPTERRAAAALSRGLLRAQGLVAAGERDAETVRRAALEVIAGEPLLRLEYLVVVGGPDLAPLRAIDGEALMAVAAGVGDTRLIDNVALRPAPAEGQGGAPGREGRGAERGGCGGGGP